MSSGTASPSSPVANASTQPTAVLNGEPVSFDFAGLPPGLVGVYQVNLQIPADAADGDSILSISSAGATSNSGVLPVHKLRWRGQSCPPARQSCRRLPILVRPRHKQKSGGSTRKPAAGLTRRQLFYFVPAVAVLLWSTIAWSAGAV